MDTSRKKQPGKPAPQKKPANDSKGLWNPKGKRGRRSSPKWLKILGSNVLAGRTKIGLTQEQFAELLEVSPRYLQSIEAGEKFPSLDILRKIRVRTGVSWEVFFAGL